MHKLSPVARNLALVFGCFQGALAFAVDEGRTLDQVVVTATRTQQSIREVPASVSVLSREQIEQSTATTVDQLLQGIPGVYAARMDASSPNRIAQTYTRGLPGNSRTLVLLDGIPMNVLYDGQVDWSQLSTQDIERVEVVRGASSGLYGANAMGGVINVISRSPEAGESTRLAAETGSMNSQRYQAAHAHSFGGTSVRLSASHYSSDGYNMWRPDATVPLANRDIIGTVKDNASLKIAQEIDAQSYVEAGLSYLKDEATGFYKPGAAGYTPQTREQYVPSVRYVRDTEQSNTSLALYARMGKQWADTLSPTNYSAISEKGYYEDRNVGLSGQHSWSPMAGHRLTIGGDYVDGSIDNHFSYPGSTRLRDTRGDLTRTGAFVQDEIALTGRWKLNVAGRFDRWTTGGNQTDTGTGQPNSAYKERSDSAFSPKLASLFKLDDGVNLRASAGRAFNLPDMFNLYANTTRGTTVYWANPDLKPETVNAFDAGVDFYFGAFGHAKATVYYNDAKDFIYSVQRNASNVDKINVGAVTTRGLELESLLRPLRGLEINASYTYSRSRIDQNEKDRALVGKELTNVPRQNAYLKASYLVQAGATVFAAANIVGKRYGNDANTTVYNSYTTFDLGGSYAFTKHFSGRLTVANVGNKVYDGIGYIAPGRVLTAGIYGNF